MTAAAPARSGPPPEGRATALLEVEDLRTWFFTDQGVARAVDGVSFTVGRGETVGVVGESGCGKTVTSLSVVGLVPAPGRIMEGSSIRFHGEELVGREERALRQIRGRHVGMIFQEPMTSLNPVLTVGSQVAEGLVRHLGLSARQAGERVRALFGEVGLPEPERRAHDYPHQLSGGMRQRVMIAMALASGPELLIADEPTTALDVTIQAQILELLADLGRRRDMAVLLITHDLGVVAEVCDRVVVMYAGQVVEAGTVGQVFHRPAHPYTRGLLASLPRVDDRGARLVPIPGTVPAATDWPAACRFADRCPSAWARCTTDPPPLLLVEGPRAVVGGGPGTGVPARKDERSARCWLVEEPLRGKDATGEERR